MKQILIGQILSIIATVLTFISYQVNSKKRLLVIQTTATACTCISYLFLGASSGFVMNIVCIIRNVVYYFQKSNTMTNHICASVLALIMTVLGVLSWQGPFSLLIIIALTANTLILAYGKPQVLRISVLFTSSLILIYNIFVFSIGGIVNEGISIISSAIGIIRFYKSVTQKGGFYTNT